MSFFVFSGTLMLQLDGFPTGDGVQVKAFIHIIHGEGWGLWWQV